MKKDSFPRFSTLLQNSHKIAIVTHWSPDGDAMGSSLALYLYLKKVGKEATVVVPNEYPDFLQWLPGNNTVLNFQNQTNAARQSILGADLIFTLDFNSYKRLEDLGNVLDTSAAPKVLIDHHQAPDDYPSYYFHDTAASSTCELIYEFISGLGGAPMIDKDIAACLYTGLMTDTGSFRYASVTAQTHLVISELMKTGIVPSDIHGAVYDNYSLNRLKLLGYTLCEKLRLVPDFPAAYFTLSKEELHKFDYQKGDTEGLVNYPFSVKGILVCALFTESEGYVKISFRSKGQLDVNKFARAHFDGGGHINAAGGKSTLSLEETEKKFLALVKNLF